MKFQVSKRIIFVFAFFFVCVCCRAQSTSAVLPDSATMAASLRYKNPSFFKRLFLGTNYRATWAKPVTLPVFNVQKMGFTIKELGGGQQTKSLRLDKDGREWALRSVDKDVTKAIPTWTHHTIVQRITQDLVSASNPYAPLVVWPLAQAAGIVEARPRFYIVPDDPALGEYRKLFENTMCLLENRDPTPDHSPIKNTEELVPSLFENNDTLMDQKAVLRARLLDMLIGDWDRHEKQWDWAIEKVNGDPYVYSIPKDRDQALFHTNGLLAKVVRVVAMKHVVGFASTTKKLKQLNTKAWNFDRLFLNGLDANDWTQTVQAFTTDLPDSVIHKAVQQLPPEIYPLQGAVVEKKLINRRNTLPNDALRYYRFIASEVVVAGTDEPERFVINRTRDSVTIQISAGANFSKPVYRRTFHRNETYEVTLLGLGGADEFIESSQKASRIRLRIDGGSGQNAYKFMHSRKIKFHDSDMNAKAYRDVVKKELRITD